MTGSMANVMLTPRSDRWSCVSMGNGANFVGGGSAAIVLVRPALLNVPSLIDRKLRKEDHRQRCLMYKNGTGLITWGQKEDKRKGDRLQIRRAAAAILIAPDVIQHSWLKITPSGLDDERWGFTEDMSATRDGASPGAPQGNRGEPKGFHPSSQMMASDCRSACVWQQDLELTRTARD